MAWSSWRWPGARGAGLELVVLAWSSWCWPGARGDGLELVVLAWSSWRWPGARGDGLELVAMAWSSWRWPGARGDGRQAICNLKNSARRTHAQIRPRKEKTAHPDLSEKRGPGKITWSPKKHPGWGWPSIYF